MFTIAPQQHQEVEQKQPEQAVQLTGPLMPQQYQQQQQQQQQQKQQTASSSVNENAPDHQEPTVAAGFSSDLPQQHPLSGTSALGQLDNIIPSLKMLTPEMMHNALAQVAQFKLEQIRERASFRPPIKEIPMNERAAFEMAFEDLRRSLDRMNNYLPMYFSCTNDETLVKTIVNMLDMVERQRIRLQLPSQVYILDMNIVEEFQSTVNESRARCHAVLRHLAIQQAQQQEQQEVQALINQNNRTPSKTTRFLERTHSKPFIPSREVQDNQESMGLPPLTRQKFIEALRKWRARSKTMPDLSILYFSNRRIDLYNLHTETWRLGGGTIVKRHDLWGAVAVKMGWPDDPTSDPGQLTAAQAASHIKIVYERLLESFELSVVRDFMKQMKAARQPIQQNVQDSQKQQQHLLQHLSHPPSNSGIMPTPAQSDTLLQTSRTHEGRKPSGEVLAQQGASKAVSSAELVDPEPTSERILSPAHATSSLETTSLKRSREEDDLSQPNSVPTNATDEGRLSKRIQTGRRMSFGEHERRTKDGKRRPP